MEKNRESPVDASALEAKLNTKTIKKAQSTAMNTSKRHVKKNMLHWCEEWLRILRPGGMLVVVTITTAHFEQNVIAPLSDAGLMVQESVLQFDNKGWTQCKLYTIRRTEWTVDAKSVLPCAVAEMRRDDDHPPLAHTHAPQPHVQPVNHLVRPQDRVLEVIIITRGEEERSVQ